MSKQAPYRTRFELILLHGKRIEDAAGRAARRWAISPEAVLVHVAVISAMAVPLTIDLPRKTGFRTDI